MPTPNMLVQSANANLIWGSPCSIRVNTFNADGTVLDVHTGYSVVTLNSLPVSSPNLGGTSVDLHSNLTAAFDTTGVTLTGTITQVNAIYSALVSLASIAYLRLSNDSGSTSSVAAKITINLDPVANDL